MLGSRLRGNDGKQKNGKRVSTSLFTIQCETCTARLKVRDVSTVGQILSCPKCESMVQVIPPPGWEPPSRDETSNKNPADKSAGHVGGRHRSALGRPVLQQKPADRQPRGKETDEKISAAKQPSSQVSTPSSKTRSAGEESSERPLPSSKQQVKSEREKVAAAAAASFAAPVTPPPIESSAAPVEAAGAAAPTPPLNFPPAAGWVSPTEKLVRQWMLVGGLLVGGGVVAGALITWAFVSGDKTSTEEISAAQSPGNHSDTDQAPDPGSQETQSKKPSALPDDSSQANTDRKPPARTPERDASPTDPPVDPPVIAHPTDTPPGDNTAVGDPPPIATAPGIDAPEIDIPDVLLPDLDGAGVNDNAAARRKNRRKPLEVIDVESRLQDPIAHIEFRKVALWRYLDFVSRMSTIPITLDTDALAQQDLLASKLISVKLDETTIEAALQSVLERLKLQLDIEHGHLLVTTPRDGTSTLLQQSFAARDLTASDLSAGDASRLEPLARLIPRLVAPTEWQENRGRGRIRIQDGQLMVNQTPKVMRQVATFLKRLRIARDHSQQSDPASVRPSLTTRYAQAGRPLSQEIAASYTVPTPLIEIIDRLREQTELAVLVDWQSLSAIHVGPMTDARMSAHGKSLESALGMLLTPLDLTFRIIDSKTIEITSQERGAAQHEIEFHSLQDLASDDDQAQRLIAQRLIAQLRKDLSLDTAAATFHYDPASRCLIVSARGQLQIEVEKRLDIERAKTAKK